MLDHSGCLMQYLYIKDLSAIGILRLDVWLSLSLQFL